MKFLVIRFSSIGDIVLASPVFRCLKQQVATAEVHFVTKLSFRSVTEANPYIERSHYLKENLGELINELQKEDFDYVIDLHNNIRSGKIRRALKKPSAVIDKENLRRIILANFRYEIYPGRHITQRSLDTLEQFGVRDDGKGLDYFIRDDERVQESDIPATHLSGYIAIVIGASYPTKRMPLEKLVELCSSIQHPLILLGGKEDAEIGEQVASIDPGKIYNACGKFKLNESADLVRRSKLVITHDTGLEHIATAFQKPVISIWGSTHPLLGLGPYYGSAAKNPPVANMLVPGLPCQPCTRVGNRKCPRGHFRCMRDQDISVIKKMAESMLGRSLS